MIDGVAYDWCDKGHKSAASPNGMYMPEGHNHEQWLQKKLARKNKTNSGGGTSQGGNSDAAKSIKLTLSEQMKSCLMTKAGFSAEEAESIFREMDLN